MQTLSSFTLDLIRKNSTNLTWMEEKKFDWVSILQPVLTRILDAKTLLVVTDSEREWFDKYIITTLNHTIMDRPLLPVISLQSIFPKLDFTKEKLEYELIEDMLSLAFPNGYTFFYTGRGDDKRATLVKRDSNSFMWLLDEQNQNALYLNSKDENLDQKLVQLVGLFDKSIDASLFMEIDLQALL